VGIIVPVGVGFVDEGTGRIHGRPVASTQLQLHPNRSTQPQFLPWLALVETPQREQDLTKRGLITAQVVEWIGWQL